MTTCQLSRAALIVAMLAPVSTVALAREERQAALDTLHTSSHVEELRVEVEDEQVAVGSRVPVTVRVYGAKGRAVDSVPELDSDAGELGPIARVGKGRYRAELSVPSSLAGNRNVFLLARTREGRVTASATLTLSPGPPASLEVEGPSRLTADGSTQAQLTIRMTDSFGNPIEGTPKVEARYGRLRGLESTGPGFWVFTYETRMALRDVDEQVLVQAGRLTTRHAVKLVAPYSPLSVSLKGGMALRAGGYGAIVGAEGAAWTQVGNQQLGLVLEGSWWSVGGDPVALGSGKVDWSYLPVTASLAWRLSVSTKTMIWLSLGGGAAKIWSSEKLTGQPTITETGWTTVATAAVAGGVRVWRGYSFLELRASWIGDAHLATLSGTIVPVFLQVGYRFDAW